MSGEDYISGSYNYKVTCDVCGFVYRFSEMKKRWDGKWVCPTDYEVRHPLDFYRTRNDAHRLPYVHNDDGGINIGPAINPITATPQPCGGMIATGYVGVGKVGCLIVGRTS